MNRRDFLGTLIGGVAATAAVRTWPFRVYSFPSKVNLLNPTFFDFFQCNSMSAMAPFKSLSRGEYEGRAIIWMNRYQEEAFRRLGSIDSHSIQIPIKLNWTPD
jgi:hypothetical protein